jgi:DNA-binding NtrC family response regulator
MQVLRCVSPLRGRWRIHREDLPLDTPQDLEKIKNRTLPAVLLVRQPNLATLARFQDLVIDRGVKNPAKTLKQLLLGHDKVPLLDGRFRNPGQCHRSIRTFLENVLKAGEGNLYLIGVSDEVFEPLWKKAVDREATFQAEIPFIAVDLASQLLGILEGRQEISAELNRRFIGNSPEAQVVRHFITLAAKITEPVLILGDTGTGKEVVARAIHDLSPRRSQKFIPLDCGAISPYLLESELFGHQKGSHATAFRDKIGVWEEAGEGTLFLDEIGNLALDHQGKILRALATNMIRPVGEEKERPVKARVLAATNRDIFSMIKAGQFMEDLYYRLRGFLIRTPALREHPDDIPLLAQFFWREITKNKAKALPEEFLAELQAYGWPGNARELKMLLHNLYALFGADAPTVEQLHLVFLYEGQDRGLSSEATPERELLLHRVECLRHLRRATEVIRATEVTLRPLTRARKLDPPTARAVAPGLSLRLSELEMLCLRPWLFKSETTYLAAHNLKGKLSYLQGLLRTSNPEALALWRNELTQEFRLASSAIFKEVDALLKSS